MKPKTVLYTRPGCHLCDVAKATLKSHGLDPEEINIDQDADLRQQYDTCVPVVMIDRQVRFRGRVNEVLLRRLLREFD